MGGSAGACWCLGYAIATLVIAAGQAGLVLLVLSIPSSTCLADDRAASRRTVPSSADPQHLHFRLLTWDGVRGGWCCSITATVSSWAPRAVDQSRMVPSSARSSGLGCSQLLALALAARAPLARRVSCSASPPGTGRPREAALDADKRRSRSHGVGQGKDSSLPIRMTISR